MKLKLQLSLIAMFFITFFINAQNSNQKIAEQWIENHSTELEIQPHHSFKMLFSRKGPSGETLRYYQMLNDVQVYDSELTIHINTIGQISNSASSYDKTIKNINTTPNISDKKAFKIAKNNIKVEGEISFEKKKLFVYNDNGITKLVYQIIIEPRVTPVGSWEVIIDAENGQVISAKDKAYYYNKHQHHKEKEKKKSTSKKKVNGNGFVYLADPLI